MASACVLNPLETAEVSGMLMPMPPMYATFDAMGVVLEKGMLVPHVNVKGERVDNQRKRIALLDAQLATGSPLRVEHDFQLVRNQRRRRTVGLRCALGVLYQRIEIRAGVNARCVDHADVRLVDGLRAPLPEVEGVVHERQRLYLRRDCNPICAVLTGCSSVIVPVLL